jgi:DNA-directed RNA polymerase specialized sigma24 family protein
MLLRHVGPAEAEKQLNESLARTVRAIQKGFLRDPNRLSSFIATVVRRQVVQYISPALKPPSQASPSAYVAERPVTPEEGLEQKERSLLMQQVLEELPSCEREALTRFYLGGEDVEGICKNMNFNPTQFRLLKSGVKARYATLVRRSQEEQRFYKASNHG